MILTQVGEAGNACSARAEDGGQEANSAAREAQGNWRNPKVRLVQEEQPDEAKGLHPFTVVVMGVPMAENMTDQPILTSI